ncbi:serine/threonine-protein kinase [Streptomyces sp. NPDC046805]|uniref:serine/threonine-protein kinase n=1 Tax=Streptomyces sp. NPDC046805 TaxID=3155134 RepID=UPI0033E87980
MAELGSGDPRRVGAYRLLARLGAGGMGQVYLARSDRGRTVAVKLVREELAAREEFRARFRQEVRAARKVGGHWTAPVLDADTEAAVPWVATGYVAGPSLQQVVGHDHGALPEQSVRILAAGLARALQDIHAAGIVHRDLKPSNVLVTVDGPRVIDFGIARALEPLTGDGLTGLTGTGSLLGSPGFMAPEQVRGDRITPACDVFSLGSVLAYAATGTLPFGTADSGVRALMFRIAQEEPDLEGLPWGLTDLVRDCLRKDPAARPSLARILDVTRAEGTLSDGRSKEPWLPGALVAQLGRHAVRLPDSETAEDTADTADTAETEDTDEAGEAGQAVGGVVEARAPGGVRDHAYASSASLEHAPAADDASAPARPAAPHPQGRPSPPRPPGAFGHGAAVDGLPAMGLRQPLPAAVSPPPPAYGHPQQAGDRTGLPAQEPPRGNGRSTLLLVAVALVVALGAGGSVYAVLTSSRSGDDQGGSGTGTTSGPSPAQAPTSPRPSPRTAPPAAGAVPAAYLGEWKTSIDNAGGHNTRELTIEQGKVGDAVLTLVADGPAGDGRYHCVFRAKLAQRPGSHGPLKIGPSAVTTGEPKSSCAPGEATEVTLLPGGRLRRVNKTSGEVLTYTKGG